MNIISYDSQNNVCGIIVESWDNLFCKFKPLRGNINITTKEYSVIINSRFLTDIFIWEQ